MAMNIEGQRIPGGRLQELRLDAAAKEALRRRAFLDAMGQKGIDTGTNPLDTARNLSLVEARMLHGLSFPYHDGLFVGSIEVRPIEIGDVQLTDVFDPTYSYQVGRREQVFDVDFYPFGKPIREAHRATGAAFLAFTDAANTIQYTREDRSTPKVIIGQSNSRMAQFAINNLGFHMTGMELVRLRRDPFEPMEIINDIDDVARGMTRQLQRDPYDDYKDGVVFHFFAKTADLQDPTYLAKLAAGRESVYHYAVASGKTQAASADEYEKELRVTAVIDNLTFLNEADRISAFRRHNGY